MEQIIYLLQFIFWTLLTGIVLIILYFVWSYFKYKRKERENKYNLMYVNFKAMLYDPHRPINKASWKELSECFVEIEALNMFAEKTDVLRGEFLKLYEPVTDEIERELKELNSEHEFDPSMIFAGV